MPKWLQKAHEKCRPNLQSGGEDHHWEPDNYPLYTMTNRDVVLRGDYDARVT